MIQILKFAAFNAANFRIITLDQIRVSWNRLWRSKNRVNLIELIGNDRIHKNIRTQIMGSSKLDPI